MILPNLEIELISFGTVYVLSVAPRSKVHIIFLYPAPPSILLVVDGFANMI